MSAPLQRRSWTVEEVEALGRTHSTWGRWGSDDDLGAANLLEPHHVQTAAGLVRQGKVVNLAIPMDGTGPMTGRNGRVNPQHLMLRDGGDVAAAGSVGFDYTDDVLYTPTQAGTQWDALCHVFHRGRTYNDRGPETVTSAGASHNAVTGLLDKVVTRGVLLDLPRWLGREWLEPGDAIQADDLEACAAAQGVTVGTGDVVLVRTGQIAERRARGSWDDFNGGPAPGLGVSAADFLCSRGVVAVATDTWGIEAIPYECDELRAPLHVVLLVHAGVWIGEMWDLDAHAAECAASSKFEFLLVAPPLPITGAVGSPLSPVAVL